MDKTFLKKISSHNRYVNHKEVKTLAQAQILTHRCTQICKHKSTNSQKKTSNYRLHTCTYTQVYIQTRSCTQFQYFLTQTFLCAHFMDKSFKIQIIDCQKWIRQSLQYRFDLPAYQFQIILTLYSVSYQVRSSFFLVSESVTIFGPYL